MNKLLTILLTEALKPTMKDGVRAVPFAHAVLRIFMR